ncbi:6-phosphogluconate dehydrogenase C-terminal domain-like protein [Suillus clintonianus]|uniref:6-phosphogluconate dehydrogenase C-terminal domain-like protein n=1 Tax=Suillus clintonianus TaxID=1904413 RepID=UPI001B85E199|nr:6-phosphogluconate dehydrogenase C-terminal domain-like protein [Suillus clintonianus]KAG2125966.1 6-phosphogluconate dehydrogenase C-terminal domain-like protein [Suillus clintonianus]
MPRLAVVAAGAMGSAVAKRLVSFGCTVYTNLDGRSEATRKRAQDAGMINVSINELVLKSDWILSILPPRDAVSFAEKIQDAAAKHGSAFPSPRTFVDCNAVNPETVKRIAALFAGTSVKFVDAGIIGGPPKGNYDPTFYASAEDGKMLDEFTALSNYGLKVSPLKGEGVGVGDASALKMSYAGITKGTTGLYTTMVLAAHASSPATADALMRELHMSQPVLLNRLVEAVPPMLPKAYRWIGEMEEIADFVGGGEGDVYRGIAKVYERIEKSIAGDEVDVATLRKFVEKAKKLD